MLLVDMFSREVVMKIGTEEVALLGRTIRDVVNDVLRVYPTPQDLRLARLYFTNDEEAALGDLMGLMWPLLFTERISAHYRTKKIPAEIQAAAIAFEDDWTVLSFTMT